MKVSELRQAAKLLQITLSRNLVKQEIVDRILLQAQPQQLDSVIQKASHDCNSKQNDMTTEELADHNRKRANEWYKKPNKNKMLSLCMIIEPKHSRNEGQPKKKKKPHKVHNIWKLWNSAIQTTQYTANH